MLNKLKFLKQNKGISDKLREQSHLHISDLLISLKE